MANSNANSLGTWLNRPIEGALPLCVAAEHGHTTLVAHLLDTKGVELDMADEDGWTALHYACDSQRSDTVALLLDRGADPNKPIGVCMRGGGLSGVPAPTHTMNVATASARTALLMAIERQDAETVRQLLQATGATGTRTAKTASGGECPEGILVQLEEGSSQAGLDTNLLGGPRPARRNIDVNLADANGTTPLHEAILRFNQTSPAGTPSSLCAHYALPAISPLFPLRALLFLPLPVIPLYII